MEAEPAPLGVLRPAGKLRNALLRCTKLAIVAAATVTTLSFLWGGCWVLELFTHFRLQLAAGAILLLAAAALGRQPAFAVLAGLTAAANFALLLPYVWPETPVANAAPRAIRIMVANVGKHNEEYEALRSLVRSQRPDLVGVLEADHGWLAALSDLSADFSYSVLRPEEGAYGMLLYSRLPMRELPESPYREDGIQTAIFVELDLPDASTTLVLAHLMAPLGHSSARLRNDQLARLAGMLEKDSNAVRILAGDLNITPWSPEYAILEQQAGLTNAALGKGYRGTWPVRPAVLRIPIDHCLVAGALEIADLRVGPDIGSDHFPLVVDLVTRSPSPLASKAALLRQGLASGAVPERSLP